MEVMVALPRFNTPKGEIPLGSSEVNLLGSRPPELSRKGSAGVTENPLVPNKQTNNKRGGDSPPTHWSIRGG